MVEEYQGRESIARLMDQYHADDPVVLDHLETESPEQLLRLFVTVHGMPPVGTWQTHTYARFTDSVTGRDHFFLIPMPYERRSDLVPLGGQFSGASCSRPRIKTDGETVVVDGMRTPIRLQAIPHTNPFWYFHYNPNLEHQPFRSMTLNLSPSCEENCPMCAGARTGRVNNGQRRTLNPEAVLESICEQYPETQSQLEIAAIVTGCFSDFETLATHLREVRSACRKRSQAHTFRVLEHNIDDEDEIALAVGELGYDVFVTMECYDQKVRQVALAGTVGRKGRSSESFLELIETYARYLDRNPRPGENLVRVTHLTGLDSLDNSERFFERLASINRELEHATILPWISIFTAYTDGMRRLQQPDFSLGFLLSMKDLLRRYFDPELLAEKSGGTAQGYARGLM